MSVTSRSVTDGPTVPGAAVPADRIEAAERSEPAERTKPAAWHDRIPDRLVHLQHSLKRLQVAMATGSAEDSEVARHRVIFMIARSEPVRLSALAESIEVEPSTLSRQVAALVKSGLIERETDPHDRRASLLTLSPAGRHCHQIQLARRRGHYERMLAAWPMTDRVDFARLLDQFVDEVDVYRNDFLAAADRVNGAGASGEAPTVTPAPKETGGRP